MHVSPMTNVVMNKHRETKRKLDNLDVVMQNKVFITQTLLKFNIDKI